MSIPYIISACLSPVLGGFVDKFGYRAVIATVAPMVLVLVHSLLGFSRVDPVGPLVGQGLAYRCAGWPSCPVTCSVLTILFTPHQTDHSPFLSNRIAKPTLSPRRRALSSLCPPTAPKKTYKKNA